MAQYASINLGTSDLIDFACDGVHAPFNQGSRDGNLLVPNK